MKKVCVIGVGLMLALGEAGAANAATYVDTVTAANPLAYFRLNSVGQGSTVNGWTANWGSGVTTGTGTPLASDPSNQAAVFNGTGGITTNVTGISGTAGTLMAWINGPAPGYDYRTVVDASNFGNTYGLTYQGSGVQGSNAQRIDFSYGGGTYQTGLLNIADGWHFIVGTFDSTAGVANLYIDGSLSGSSTSNVVDRGPRTDQFAIGQGGSNFCDGAGGTFCTSPQSMNGSIDEAAIFNYALSANQIANIYASRNNAASPVGAVPEPASWAMMIVGFGMIGAGMRYRQRRMVLRYI